MDHPADPNVFETANAGFAQALYEDYLRDPNSVAPDWRILFESGRVGERPAAGNGAATTAAGKNGGGTAAPSSGPPPAAPGSQGNAAPIKGPAARLVHNMTESLSVPTATTFREIPVAVLESARSRFNAGLKAAGRAEKASFTHFIAWALVQAAR
jgi:2-oxoglutarate dehydrogenase E1 component